MDQQPQSGGGMWIQSGPPRVPQGLELLSGAGNARRHGHGRGRLIAILLIVGGVLALVYGGFGYTKNTQEAKIGPVELM